MIDATYSLPVLLVSLVTYTYLRISGAAEKGAGFCSKNKLKLWNLGDESLIPRLHHGSADIPSRISLNDFLEHYLSTPLIERSMINDPREEHQAGTPGNRRCFGYKSLLAKRASDIGDCSRIKHLINITFGFHMEQTGRLACSEYDCTLHGLRGSPSILPRPFSSR